MDKEQSKQVEIIKKLESRAWELMNSPHKSDYSQELDIQALLIDYIEIAPQSVLQHVISNTLSKCLWGGGSIP